MAFNCERYTGAGEEYDGLGLSTRGAEGIQVQITGNIGGRQTNQVGVPAGTARATSGVDAALKEAKHGCLDRCYLTIVSLLKILLKMGVAQVPD